ncbi:MAG TPA: tetratricopeptide repeat protein [Pyrinomonadaceae bacterium]|jgi:tetratricopeptide (TPR) repeat protein
MIPRLLIQSTRVLIFIGLFSFSLAAHAQSGTLDKLRYDLAMRYLEPAPHMALAKFFHDKGDRLQAFYLLEAARRGRFEEPIFNQAFVESFQAESSDNERDAPLLKQYKKRIEALFEKEPARAKAIITEALAKYPADVELHFNYGALLQREGNLREAEAQLVKAAELAPRSSYYQAWVGRFFFKVKRDNQRALAFYLNAYFLNPHAYETEFVESRIRAINWGAAEARVDQLLKSGTPLIEITRDSNPTVVVQAVTRAAENWRPEYLATMLILMEHDDEEVRWLATEAIKNHADRSFDEQLRALLQEKDLRKRGLAAYIAVHLWKQESFPVMQAMLREEAQLLRFDALSALVLEGGTEGLRIVREHRRSELNPTLQKLIDSVAPKKGLSTRDL